MAWEILTAYTFKQKYVFTVSYGYSSNHIMRTLIPDSDGVTIKNLAGNVGNKQQLDFIASVPVQFFSFWQLQLTTDISYAAYPIQQSQGTTILSKWSPSLFAQQQFKLPGDIKMDVTTSYNAPEPRGTYITKGFFYTDVGFKKSFIKNVLDAQLTFTNIFNSVHYAGTSQSNLTDYYYDNKPDTRRIAIMLHYHFGSDLIKGNNKTTEEQQRL